MKPEIIKVKMFESPSANGKNKKLTKMMKNGKGEKPLKIKRKLTTEEKFAFANQVAQAQLVKGTVILEDPRCEPPPPARPAVKIIPRPRQRKKKVAPNKTDEKEEIAMSHGEPGYVPVEPPPPARPTAKVIPAKTPRPRQRKKKAAPNETDVCLPVTETAPPIDALQTNGVVKKKTAPRKRQAQPKVPKVRQDTEANVSSTVAETAPPIDKTNGVVKKKTAPRKGLVRRKQVQPKVEQDKEANVAGSGLLIDRPTPVKKRRGRPKKLQIEQCCVESVSPRSLGKLLNNTLATSTNNLSETTQKDTRKIKDNSSRPESKVSDTFSWAADISTSPSNSNACVLIDGKLPTVEIIDYLKYPNLSAKTSLTSLSSRCDAMTSPNKRKTPRSPAKNICTQLKRNKTHIENDKGHIENKRPRKHRERSGKTDEENNQRQTNTERKAQSKDRKVLELEAKKTYIDSCLQDFHQKWNMPQLASYTSQKKKLEKPAKPVHHGRSEATSSSEGKPKGRPRASSKRRLRSDRPQVTNRLPIEVHLSTPVQSPSPSLIPSSSTSITMSDSTSATPTSNECKPANDITKALDRLQQTLNNVDMEFLEWIPTGIEDDDQNDEHIPDITFNVLKNEVEAIRLCQKFKMGIPNLSSSEKSVGSVDMKPSDEDKDQFEHEGRTIQEPVTEPNDVPDAPEVEDLAQYVYDEYDDDAISLHAESISCFTRFDSVINSGPIAPIMPVVANNENPPVAIKTAVVQKQNADSSTYRDTRAILDSQQLIKTPTVIKTPERQSLLMADIYNAALHRKSVVFYGYCFYNLISQCRKIVCMWPHVFPEPTMIRKKLSDFSEQLFISEYLLLRKNPLLRIRYMKLYVDECQKRDLTRFLVEMASDAGREQPTTKTYIMETTLLHLNDKELETCKDILTKPLSGSSLLLCDEFMNTIAETQNFSRFKPVFVKLTTFLEQRGRKVDPGVAEQIFERISILPYEEPLAQAAKALIKGVSSIFGGSHMIKYLQRLAENSAANKANVENVRYTSPDTTHLDRLQNKPPDATASITQAADSAPNHTFTQRLAPPAQSGDGFQIPAPSGDSFQNHAPSGDVFLNPRPRPRFPPPRAPWPPRDHGSRGMPRFRGKLRAAPAGSGAFHFRRPRPNLYY